MFDQLMAQTPMVHAAATWFMVGLIWFVQVVHYPLMGAVQPHAFSAYATSHQRRTTWVVGPVMLLEGSSALLLVWSPHGEFAGTLMRWMGLALLVLIWTSTFAVQVPLHARLASAFDRAVWRRLVATNWVRTIAWTARGIIALLLLGSA
ncbi:MAG: hypothetical protein ACKVZJ_13300 [Phycisphaerales bacterium]